MKWMNGMKWMNEWMNECNEWNQLMNEWNEWMKWNEMESMNE